jgi:hypothetical protein
MEALDGPTMPFVDLVLAARVFWVFMISLGSRNAGKRPAADAISEIILLLSKQEILIEPTR